MYRSASITEGPLHVDPIVLPSFMKKFHEDTAQSSRHQLTLDLVFRFVRLRFIKTSISNNDCRKARRTN